MIFLSILSFLFWPIVIIGLIIFFAVRRGRHSKANKEWHSQFALSKEDAVSQLFFLLSFLFLGVTLLALNKDFGDPLPWRTIIFITSLLGLIGAYYLKAIYVLIFSIIGVAGWWVAQAALWVDQKNTASSAVFLGLSLLALLFYVLGHLHEKEARFKRFSLVYSAFGVVAPTFILFLFSTKPGIALIEQMIKGGSFFHSWQLTLSLFILFASLMVSAFWAVAQKLIFPLELLAVFALTLLFGGTALLSEQPMFLSAGSYYSYYDNKSFSGVGLLLAMLYNVAILLELMGLIFSGYVRRASWLINLGAVFLFLLIIVKYFDWFFSFMSKSVFFVGAGILFFLVGWFMEQGRKSVVSKIKVQNQQIPE